MEAITNFLVGLSVMGIPILLAITLHEAAHGYVAKLFGDLTAERAGRLTLNPVAHIDPFGTVLLPLLMFFLTGFIFGYAKPVPVTFANLRHPKRDMIWVALAGPAANAFLALAGAALALSLGLVPEFMRGWLADNLQFLIFFNFIIGILNLMPILPLDGGRVVAGLLPGPLARRYARSERYGILIFIGLIFVVPFAFNFVGVDFNPAYLVIFEPACNLYAMVANLVGLENVFCP